MNEVNLKYVEDYLERKDAIITRCKDITALIHDHSDNNQLSPFWKVWDEEDIKCEDEYILLSLVHFGPYGDCGDGEEYYYIPVSYFDMSEEEIVADIKEKDAKDKESQYYKDLEDLRRTAVRLGCKVEELPK